MRRWSAALIALAVVVAQLIPQSTTAWTRLQAAAAAEVTPRSLALDGLNGFAEAASAPDLNLTGDWTIELWFKDADPGGFGHAYRYLLDKGDGVAAESPFYLLLGIGSLLAGVRHAGVNHPLTFELQAAGYSPKIWQHVAVTYQSRTTLLTLYLNGRWAAQQSVGVTPQGNTLPLEIGRQGPALGRYWLGGLDDVRVWNLTRSAEDIQAAYLSELSAPPPGLVANWRFDGDGQDLLGTHLAVLATGASLSADAP